MRLENWIRPAALALAGSMFLLTIGTVRPSRGDEPFGLFGRIFRMGEGRGEPRPESDPSMAVPPADPLFLGSAPNPGGSPDRSDPNPGEASRIMPQPRDSQAPTTADPLLTRISIGASEDGSQFGTFIQIFADGTVLDPEGVRRADPRLLRPLQDAIRASDAQRRQGHCGGPPTDYLEMVQLIAFERSFGRLKANAFTYSGNMQGCDAGLRQLQTVIDAFQAELDGSTYAAPEAAVPFESTGPTSAYPATPPPFVPEAEAPGAQAGPVGPDPNLPLHLEEAPDSIP